MTASVTSSAKVPEAGPGASLASRLDPWLARLGAGADRRLVAGLFLLALAAWLLARPYTGIRHDGMLYMAQALMRRWPDIYSGDFFFAHGSQDRFSIFSSVFAWLADHTSWVGIVPVLLLGCQLACALTLVLLLRQLLPLPFVALGLMLAAASPYYGGYAMFSYGEPFLTARSMAEPLVLAALAVAVAGRPGRALPLLALAAVMHPLIALPGIGIWFVMQAERRPRLWWLVLVVPAVFAAAALGVPGLEALTARFDPQWWSGLGPNAAVFPQNWPMHDWADLMFDLVVLATCSRIAEPRLASLARAALLVGAVGVGAAAWGGEVLRFVLATQAQLWRAQWTAHALACGVFPWLVWRLRNRGPYAWLGLALIFSGIAFRAQDNALFAPLLGALALWWAHRGTPAMTRAFRMFAIAAVGFLVVAAAVNDLNLSTALGLARSDESDLGYFQRLFESPGIGAAMLALGATLALRLPRHGLAVGVLALVVAFGTWDRRSDWSQYIEAHLDSATPWDTIIPRRAQVYWPQDLQAPWLLIKRASYFTLPQGSGLIFNRDTAMDYHFRRDVVDVFEVQSELCRKFGTLLGSCTIGPDAMQEACARKGGPDFIVTPRSVAVPLRDHWVIDLGQGGKREYFLYDCATVAVAPLAPPAPRPPVRAPAGVGAAS